ncbi:hypothetical protein IFR05_015598 [Cadophora sp. M221]|nr:hypothetical protein IFR05_015598 [Cadophora sp. M221]
MSRRSSDSTNRRLSEDSVSAKRQAEEERNSTEPSKRARRSSSRFAQDETGDFIIVSSGSRRKRKSVDVKIEEEQHASYDDPKSPVRRIHPDCEISEEGAKKAVDVWNSLQYSSKVSETVRPRSSGSDNAREGGFSSPTPSEKSSSVEENLGRRVSAPSLRESMGSVAPGSEWSSTHGSEHARAITVRTPGSETHADTNPISRRSTPQAQGDANHQTSGVATSTGKQRTRLPSYREQSPLHGAATMSHPIVISPDVPQSSVPNLSNKPRDSTERSWTNENAPSHAFSTTHNTQDQSTSQWRMSETRRGSHDESHKPRWEHDSQVPAPALDRLSNKSDSPANRAYPVTGTVPSSVAARDPRPFMTFPSSFSVLTTESVQQKSQAKPGKRRGRKPANHNIERPRKDLSMIVPQPEADKPGDFISDDGLPRQQTVPPPHSQQSSRPAQSGLPAIPVAHGFYQTKLPPRPTTTPPPVSSVYPSESYRPPALVFTVDNGVRSELVTADVQSFVNKFKHNTRAIITGFNNQNKAHEIDVIMFQSLPLFYQWYSDNTGITDIGPLRFELIDVHWQQERSFVVPDGNLGHYRTLKQYIWDLYWMAMDMSNAPSMFRVTISQFPPRGEASLGEDTAASGWKAVNSSIPTKFTPISQGIMVVPTGIPQEFQKQAHTSPPNHPLSILPPPTLRSTHSSSLSSINDPKASPRNNQAPNLPSPNQSPYLHGPYSRDSFQQPRQNETESRDQAQLQSQSLYGTTDVRRTAWDQTLLRDYARSLKLRDAELMSEESTVKDKLPYKTGAEVCAVVVDKMSGKGLVTVSGKGYITLNITTGPDETGERFKEVTIQPKQTCMLHGGPKLMNDMDEMDVLQDQSTIKE